MNGSSWSRFAQRRGYSGILLGVFLTSTITSAEIQPSDCARAAKYSEGKRGVSILVMQNGRSVFEHYANGGSARGRWPIFSGTKSFWGIAALAAVRDGLFKLDDPKALRVFSVHRFAIGMRWRFDCRPLLNPVRLSSMARVMSRFFQSCYGEN
ncbi:MAG: hypothetical protein DMF37_09125 [Verrucomicrobia bacterium]|nr:MAG: hypothetical protein DMF37_09125 [Verrucomicrobiota bacterium]